MLSPISGFDSLSDGSHKKILFRCSCGRNTLKEWRAYKQGLENCGRCEEKDPEYWMSQEFGSLKLSVPSSLFPKSNKKVFWDCKCGGQTSARVIDVTTGRTRSCGSCNKRSYDSGTRFNDLVLLHSISLHDNSRKKVSLRCKCGRITSSPFVNVISGKKKSCGKCSTVSKERNSLKYSKLTMLCPIECHPHSVKKVDWICDCGNKKKISIADVLSGKTKSCGHCNILNSDYWSISSFGRLNMLTPSEYAKYSHEIVEWKCSCGNITTGKICDVSLGKKRSCSDCLSVGRDWYDKNKSLLISLEFPINPADIPEGWFKIIEPIKDNGLFRCQCAICKNEFTPTWSNVKNGKSLSCGCSTNKISKGHKEIFDFINSLGIKVNLEHRMDKFTYDIFVESSKLLIEFNGLYYHSSLSSKRRDLEKYRLAIELGYSYLMIYEDEWEKKREIVQNIIRNRLGVLNPIRVRSSKLDIKPISREEANELYDLYHYLGSTNVRFHYGVYFDDILIACASFGTPTRQNSRYDYEIVRMVSDPHYRAPGVFARILREFIRLHSPKSIVSFSDNRLFSGSIYSKLGFKKESDVPSDYYWVRGMDRRHKSGMRLSVQEKTLGMSECAVRESQGYSKIWDLGKIRWSL